MAETRMEKIMAALDLDHTSQGGSIRQKMHYCESYSHSTNIYAQEVENSRENHSDPGPQRICIDYCSHRISGVVKPIYRLKGHCDIRPNRVINVAIGK